ncbi:carbohydrate binding protein with CBMX2 domain [Diaminobutyricimonas aerilata]|uniref:Alpha-galactosidase n=1 Tax=Diaminobutyricimonas aerilata TaxID=1162967 RepID=A0A2M9CN68_9MICO|nr:X2-like carbohydrate binding domain-containing protein [Diaminobutyricimonas aerilata]PJJ73349.1 carbohydrate binding protein with CBMX2 domain [Diaminobutyricimonas aerilata]
MAAALTATALGALCLTAPSWAAATPVPAPDAGAATPAAAESDPAAKPYMGWSSFSMQVYSGNGQWITADQLIAQSDAMHEKLQAHGYEYINVDAGWNGGVDEYGRPTPSETLYPNGLQAVIDHVHENGQKFGLYFIPGIGPEVYEADLPIYGAEGCSTGDIAAQPLQQADYWDIGYKIDFSNPCSQKYIDSIVDLIAGWGVDFVKFDSVTPGSGIGDLSLDARDDVKAWSQALDRHDIWLELSWALDIRYADYWKQYADGWRVDWDVECYCAHDAMTTWDNIARLFSKAAQWWRHAGPGGWNDFDSLNVGNGAMDGLTRDERRTAMTFWAVSAVPIYTGNDLTNLDEYGLELLTNDDVIAVNQNGVPARPVSTETDKQVWYAPNADGTVTAAVFNLDRTESDIEVRLSDIGIEGSATVTDVWSGEELGKIDGGYVAQDVPIHGSRLFTITPAKGARLTVTDDDLRVSYDGTWTRNGNQEVAAQSQPLTVKVTDAGGEQPPAASVRTVALNDDDPAISYQGSWNHSTNRGLGDHQDDVHYAEKNGDAVEHTFVGTGIDYVTETHESQGEVDVYLDGEFQQTVNAYRAEGRGAQQVLYSVDGLPNGTHTLRLVKKSGSFMLLDRLDVRLDSLLVADTALFDKSAPTPVEVGLLRDGAELTAIAHGDDVLTAGEQYTVEGRTVALSAEYLAAQPSGDLVLDFRFRGDHRDDVHSSTDDGASFEVAFRGTAVEWIAPMGPDQGEVEIYLDGKLVDTVDTHADSRLTQRSLFTTEGLKNGDHTFKAVQVSGDILRHDTIEYTVKKVK